MQPPHQYKHLFFDLDGTVTRSRSQITPEMKATITKALEKGYDIIIVSGARVEQSLLQTDNLPLLFLGQNGNHAYDAKTDTTLWHEMLTDTEKKEIFKHIQSIPRTWPIKDEQDLVEDRGSQISYSLLGHHEEIAAKEKFDKGGKRRAELLEQHPLMSETIQVAIGGTTTFDYFRKGLHKGHNVTRLIREKGWKVSDCVYVGDALYEGGNDETVIGIIETKPVKEPEETEAFIRENTSEAV